MDRWAASLAAHGCPTQARPPGEAPPGRAQLEGRVAVLNAELLSHDSATLALERWCRANGLACDGAVAAQLVSAADAEPTAEQRSLLRIGPAELVRHRRVRLLFGQRLLSEAENWYVPGRLTPAMRWRLDRTTVPFGRVVRALRFRRLRLAIEPLWPSSTDRWAATHLAARMPSFVLRHRALLLRADGLPFSEVVETYTWDALLLDRLT